MRAENKGEGIFVPFSAEKGNKPYPTESAAKSAVKTVGFLFKLCYTCYGRRFLFDRLRSGWYDDTKIAVGISALIDSMTIVTPNCLRPAFPLFVKNEFRESAL